MRQGITYAHRRVWPVPSRGKHVRHQASGLIPASASPFAAKPAAAGSKTEPEIVGNAARFLQETERLHCGSPMRTIRGGQGAPASAGARKARINQRVQHETYLPTFRYPPQAYPWFPRAHEDPRRPCRDQRSPRQGPQAPGNLSAGRPARSVDAATVRRRTGMSPPSGYRLAPRMARNAACRSPASPQL